MRVMVSGGTGLIGRPLVRRLMDKGHEVEVLSRSRSGVTGGVTFVKWDGRSMGAWASELSGCNAVIHLAGEGLADGRWTENKKRRILESRTQSTQVLVEAIEAVRSAQDRPSIFVQGSAVGWYGPTQSEVDETAEPGSDFLADVCRAWEAASAPLDALGLRRPILRTGVVLSRQGGALAKMLPPFKLGLGGPLGSGGQWFPWIHLTDEVEAIVHLLEHESASGPFNLTAPQVETNRSFSNLLGKVLKRPVLLPAPAFALKLMLGEMSTLLLTGQKAVPRALEESGFQFAFNDAESALRDLLG